MINNKQFDNSIHYNEAYSINANITPKIFAVEGEAASRTNARTTQ